MRLLLSLLALGVLLLIPVQAQDDSPPSWCVSVWFPSSEDPDGLGSIAANAAVISEVHPFWYTPRADGSIAIAEYTAAYAEDPDLLDVWRAAGLRITPSIFAGVSDVIMTPEARATHIEQIVALVERMDYDGIDIDYEGFGLPARDAFSLFIEALSEALHERGRLLSVTVHAKTDDAGAWEGAASQDWTRLAPPADVFRIMTYDYTSRNQPPGVIGPLAWTLDVLAYAETITDLQKVRMGLHFYGYRWIRYQAPAMNITWRRVQEWVTNFGAVIQRDSASGEAFAEIDPPRLPRQIAYVADAEGLRFKLEPVLAAFPMLGGVSIWGMGGEDPGNWEVLRELRPPSCVFASQND